MKHSNGAGPENPRLPSLDGLRAISILMVILGHLSGTRNFGRLELGIGNYAHLGVVIFFVISGYLITSLLVSEQQTHGRISLKLFYARRTLRILPASYVYLIVLCVLTATHMIKVPLLDLICAFTYTINFLPNHAWQVGHLWSLGVEEQFYLLWPFGFSIMKARKRTWAVLAVMVIAVLSRLAARLFLVGTPYRDLPMFPMVADSLATGCLLALSRNWLEQQRWYLNLFRPLPSLAVVAIVLGLNRLAGYTLASVFGTTILNLGIGLLIHRCVFCPSDAMGRVLNWKPLVFIGTMSYSLYIWQQLFLNRHAPSVVNAFPQNVLLAAGAALGSYYLIERPLNRLRSRLRHKQVPQTQLAALGAD